MPNDVTLIRLDYRNEGENEINNSSCGMKNNYIWLSIEMK